MSSTRAIKWITYPLETAARKATSSRVLADNNTKAKTATPTPTMAQRSYDNSKTNQKWCRHRYLMPKIAVLMSRWSSTVCCIGDRLQPSPTKLQRLRAIITLCPSLKRDKRIIYNRFWNRGNPWLLHSCCLVPRTGMTNAFGKIVLSNWNSLPRLSRKFDFPHKTMIWVNLKSTFDSRSHPQKRLPCSSKKLT